MTTLGLVVIVNAGVVVIVDLNARLDVVDVDNAASM